VGGSFAIIGRSEAAQVRQRGSGGPRKRWRTSHQREAQPRRL